jgi:hypothetical protein
MRFATDALDCSGVNSASGGSGQSFDVVPLSHIVPKTGHAIAFFSTMRINAVVCAGVPVKFL